MGGGFRITRLIGVCLDPFHLAHFLLLRDSLGIDYRLRADKSYNDLLRVGPWNRLRYLDDIHEDSLEHLECLQTEKQKRCARLLEMLPD
jgi:hypothetical protein